MGMQKGNIYWILRIGVGWGDACQPSFSNLCPILVTFIVCYASVRLTPNRLFYWMGYNHQLIISSPTTFEPTKLSNKASSKVFMRPFWFMSIKASSVEDEGLRINVQQKVTWTVPWMEERWTTTNQRELSSPTHMSCQVNSSSIDEGV